MQKAYTTDQTAMEILRSYSKFPPQDATQSRDVPTLWTETAFRNELDGVLVYDSHARINDEVQSQAPFTVPLPEVDVDALSDFDREQFCRMKPVSRKRYYPQTYQLQTPRLKTLMFESRFESGNLRKAARVSEDEYNLWVETDFGTQAHTQWYYFAVGSYKARHRITFNILNFTKPFSLYSKGLQPVIHSKVAAEKSGQGWVRGGAEVDYFENSIPKDSGGYYHTLRFTYTFEFANDRVSFAHCFPYTYSDLRHFLGEHLDNDCLRVDTLCETIAGNAVPVLTITQDVDTYTPWNEDLVKLTKTAAGRRLMRIKAQRREAVLQKVSLAKGKKPSQQHYAKQGVILTARVHPGESNSSIVMEGFLAYILGNSRTARFLRSRFVFRVIPMLNPDGVIYGNYRTSLLGVDLNRRWQSPNRELHPEIYHSKRLIRAFSEDHKVLLYCDLHGHSIQHGAFMYGCRHRGSPLAVGRSNALIQMLPALMAQRSSAFTHKSCRYRMERSKQSTARIVMFKELGVSNSYTLETSFQGTESAHFTQECLKNLGACLAQQVLAFSCPRFFKKQLEQVIQLVQKPQAPPALEEALDSDSELDDPTLYDDDWTADFLQLISDEAVVHFEQLDEEDESDSEDSNSCSSDAEQAVNTSTVVHHEISLSCEALKLKSGTALCKVKRPKQRVKLADKSQSRTERAKEDQAAKLEYLPANMMMQVNKPETSVEARRPIGKIYTMRRLTQTYELRRNSKTSRGEFLVVNPIKLGLSFNKPKPSVSKVKTVSALSPAKVQQATASSVKIASISFPKAAKHKSRVGLHSTIKPKRNSALPLLTRNSRQGVLTINSFFL